MSAPSRSQPYSQSPAGGQNGNSASRKHMASPSVSRLSMISKKSGDEEGKTAVKVAIRIRPPPSASDPTFELIPQRFRNSACSATSPSTLQIGTGQGSKIFIFDRVFPDTDSQEGIWEYASEGVTAFLAGYNVSVLAYGQSGAGKSYTMGTAGATDFRDQGIIPRAATTLFEKLSASTGQQSNIHPTARFAFGALTSPSPGQDQNKSWVLKATYVEIYNEQLRDLLVAENLPPSERGTVSIREDAKGRILITGARQVNINSVEDFMDVLNFGSAIRQTDSTGLNAKSSRSHAVFSLNLTQKKPKSVAGLMPDGRQSYESPNKTDETVTTDSKLHFVDLAGSERLKNSGLTGEKVKEGISINAGLASLGKVIAQLSSRSAGSHVSYRDSRLTRLLEDSLGGNAITYMVACINPVEFHLSETLNTVQYAQRARAIQSKPKIQQRTDAGEKQLVIDRLRSEVACLRDQIRLSEQSERRDNSHENHTGRKQARENELQNQVLDAQENYITLSQRHAKLVAELTKGKSASTNGLPVLNGNGASKNGSLERLNRSSDFAEAVEQVIVEYEKTIQALETSLSNTKSSLSTSETSLLEREAKIVYMDAVTQQLQGRIQKANDREASNEVYLREMEASIDGFSTGEDKHITVIQDLRAELARARKSETSAEGYILMLEERLAEAEQDTDLMQREINRLEHVVQRQRTVVKMDNLLHELDAAGHKKTNGANGFTTRAYRDSVVTDAFHDRLVATTSGAHPDEELLPETAEAEWKSFGPMEGEEDNASQYTADPEALNIHSAARRTPMSRKDGDEKIHSPAQAKALTDKLETITMEFFDLRVDHEAVLIELDDVSRKYQNALNTLAELQDAVDEARQTRTTSFLDHAGMNEHKEDGQPSSSRMLSSELSSLGESPTLVMETSDADTSISDKGVDGHRHVIGVMQKEETLAGAIRALKRANAEKDISISELTENYSQLQDQHNDTLNYIEELKEEMQKSQAVITAKPAQSAEMPELAMVRTVKEQVLESKRQMAALNEVQVGQADELSAKIESFKARLAKHASFVSSLAIAQPEQEAQDALNGSVDGAVSGAPEQPSGKVQSEEHPFSAAYKLEDELSKWQAKYHASSSASHTLQQQILLMVGGVEWSLESIENLLAQRHAENSSSSELRTELAQHKNEAVSLQRQIKFQGKNFTALEKSYLQIVKANEQEVKSRDVVEKDLQRHRDLVLDLEDQIDQQKSLAAFHRQGLKITQDPGEDLGGLRSRLATQHSVMNSIPAEQGHSDHLHKDLRGQQQVDQLVQLVTPVLDEEAHSNDLPLRIRSITNKYTKRSSKQAQASEDLAAMYNKMYGCNDSTKQELEARIEELTAMNEETLSQLENSLLKERRTSKIALALEEQLSGGSVGKYYSPRAEKSDPQREIEEYKTKVALLESQLAKLNHTSETSLPSSRSTAPLTRKPTVPLAATLSTNDYETRIRTIEKHLYAEKQLTQTLEEALVDLETQSNRQKTESEAWKRKCRELEEEASGLRRERGGMRDSLRVAEEERDRRIRAEAARRQLEERMESLAKGKGKRGLGALNCF